MAKKKKTTKTKKKNASKSKSKEKITRRGRGLWKGAISFGLVNIPIVLESAEQAKKIGFRMLDKRDNAPVGYKTINKKTGKEIDRKEIIKGYEYEKDQYVLIDKQDFEKANPKATSTIDIEDFVEADKVDPMLLYRPYYVLPQKGGEKAYALLRDVLKKTEKVAIAKIVLHTVQHLVMLMARGDYIILELLRFADEVKEVSEVDFLPEKTKEVKPSNREIEVATELVNGMTSDWNPAKYKNSYREDLMDLIERKIETGTTASVDADYETEKSESAANVLDLTAMLKKSLNLKKQGSKERRAH